jgi:hypothetical protein
VSSFCWTRDNFDAIASCDPPLPACNRLADNWRPLFAVAQVIGGHWPARILDSFTHLTANPRTTAQDLGPTLLADIRAIFDQSDASHLFSSVLVDSLCALHAALQAIKCRASALENPRPR